MSLRTLITEYQQQSEAGNVLTPSSVRNYVCRLNYLLFHIAHAPEGTTVKTWGAEAYLDAPQLCDFTPVVVRAYLLHLAAHLPKCYRTGLNAVTSFTRWLIAEGKIPSFDMPEVKKPRVEPPRRIPPTEAELTTMMTTCENLPYDVGKNALVRAIMSVLINAGLRRNEVVSLMVEDFQPERACLRVWNTKGKTHRSVFLPEECVQDLSAWLEHRALLESKSDRLFLTTPNRPICGERVADMLQAVLKLAGLTHLAISPHYMRHAFITRCIAASVPIPVVQAQVGHRDIQSTMRYTHIREDHQQQYAQLGGLKGKRAEKTPPLTDVVSTPAPPLKPAPILQEKGAPKEKPQDTHAPRYSVQRFRPEPKSTPSRYRRQDLRQQKGGGK